MNPIYRLKSIVNHIVRTRGYHVERMIDYGEYRLNIFHLLIDQLQPERPDFFFLQVGANDGQTDDPLRELIARYRWRGLLLEPQPHVFERLAANYRDQPQLILENAALANADGTIDLWTAEGAEVLASFDRDRIISQFGNSLKLIKIPVQAVTAETLVRRHGIDHIDLLVIDTEGFDYQVCKQAMGEGLPRPRLIRYEHLHLSPADRSACASLLGTNGYRLLRDGIDTIAYRSAEPQVTTHFD